jgi:tetrahedral aminopeptidase
MNNISLLKQLCETEGISDNEEPIRKIIASELKEKADQIKVDKLGNIIALKKADITSKGPQLKVMIAAHMDEIRFLVKYIE